MLSKKLIENSRRRVVSLRLAECVIAAVKRIIREEKIVTDNNKPYPFSWFIEDMIVWILSDEERLQEFLNDNYVEE